MNIKSVVLLVLFMFQFCNAQKTENPLPKIENYNKGELEIKVLPTGLDNPILVGKITADGTIHFNFPETDLGTSNKMPLYSTQKIGRAFGFFVCHDKAVKAETEHVVAIEVKDLFLYKYGERVGALRSASSKDILENDFILGSKLLWVLSSGPGVFEATCTVYEEDGLGSGNLDKKNIRNETSYNIQLNKGWNIIEQKLLETKALKDDQGAYSSRLKERKRSVTNIPSTINWYLKYWANDAHLEIEQQLIKKTPINKTQYKEWVPKKLGSLNRTNYEIGKTLERLPTLNNIEIQFEKALKKATITIIDCVASKVAAGIYTVTLDMASSDWKDKTKTGYSSASNKDGTRVITDYNKAEAKTSLIYNAGGRFVVKAEAVHIEPETLWNYVKALNLKELIDE